MSVHPAGGMQVEKVLDDLIYRLANVDATPEIRAALVEAKRLKSVTTRWGAIPPPPDAKREMLARVMELISSVSTASPKSARAPNDVRPSGRPMTRQSPMVGRAARQSETPTMNHRRGAPASSRPTSPPPPDNPAPRPAGRPTPVGDAAIPREALPSLMELDPGPAVERALMPTSPPPPIVPRETSPANASSPLRASSLSGRLPNANPSRAPLVPRVSAAGPAASSVSSALASAAVSTPPPSSPAAGRRPPPLRRPTPLATAATLAGITATSSPPPSQQRSSMGAPPQPSVRPSAAAPARPASSISSASHAALPPPRGVDRSVPASARRPTRPPPPTALMPSAEPSERGGPSGASSSEGSVSPRPSPVSYPPPAPSRPLTLRPPVGGTPTEAPGAPQAGSGHPSGGLGVSPGLASALSPPRMPAMSTRLDTPNHPQPFTRTQSALPAVDSPLPIVAVSAPKGEVLDGLSTSISSAHRRAVADGRARPNEPLRSSRPGSPTLRPRPTELSVEVAEGINVVRPQATHWQPHPFAVGASLKLLYHNEKSGTYTALVRLVPGATFPARRHVEPEEMLMLNGSAQVGSVEMHAGDYSRALAGSSHPAIVAASGCTFLLSGSEHDELLSATGAEDAESWPVDDPADGAG